MTFEESGMEAFRGGLCLRSIFRTGRVTFAASCTRSQFVPINFKMNVARNPSD